MHRFRTILTPSEWLAQKIECHDIPKALLARHLGVDASQFSRWVEGTEQVPRAHLAELASVFPPWDVGHVLRLKDCKDFADQVKRRILAFLHDLGLSEQPATALFQRVEELAAGDHSPTSPPYAETLQRYLVDAAYAVHLVHEMTTNAARPLLPPESIARFRYPVNHFVGLLLELDNFVVGSGHERRAVEQYRESVLEKLRSVVYASPSKKKLSELARQFSMHVLARYGATEDREQIQDFFDPRKPSADPLLRRLSFTGIVLGGKRDPDLIEKFALTLRRDSSLASVNLLFNAFHYGDVTFSRQGDLPENPRRFTHAIPHVLRHLEQADRYANILDVECLTLIEMSKRVGQEPFQRSAVLPRIEKLLRHDSPLSRLASTPIQQQLQHHFSRLSRSA